MRQSLPSGLAVAGNVLVFALVGAFVLTSWALASGVVRADSPQGEPSDGRDGVDFATRTTSECGPNSLYMLLRLRGHSVSYEQVSRRLEIGPSGTSLLQLQRAAAALNVKAQVCRLTFEDFVRCPKPVIAHFREVPWSGADTAGHYVVVLDVDDSGVDILDGSFGTRRRCRLYGFQYYWSGYVLTIAPPVPWEARTTIAAVGLWTALVIWRWRRKPRPAEAMPTRPGR
jgi:predicted double-glycine peptidase